MANDENITNNTPEVSDDELWYLNNYVLLRDYYDKTISRIAARCVRKGNIAIEDYPFYSYILDVLEEIVEVGEYIISHKSLYPYVDKKIVGGIDALRKNLKEYKDELFHNSTPDMIKEDKKEIDKLKKALGGEDDLKGFDPTKGAGMNMDELMNKLMAGNTPKVADEPAPEIAPSASKHDDTRKIIKVKKPVNVIGTQAVPRKTEAEE